MTTITIHNAECAETEALSKAIERAIQFCGDQERHVDIYAHDRVPGNAPEYHFPGRLEYGIFIREKMDDPKAYFILMMQRGPRETYEFHS